MILHALNKFQIAFSGWHKTNMNEVVNDFWKYFVSPLLFLLAFYSEANSQTETRCKQIL